VVQCSAGNAWLTILILSLVNLSFKLLNEKEYLKINPDLIIVKDLQIFFT